MTAIDVACFGELLWDLYELDATPPKKGVAVATYARHLGGASANAAVAAAKLGARTSAVGAVGGDRFGAALVAELDAAGVETAHVAQSKGLRTGITFVTRSAAGQPSFLPYRSGTADLAMTEADVRAGAAKARFVVVGSSSLLPSMRAATETFLAAADKAGAAVVVDLNARAHLWPDVEELRQACRELAGRAAIVKASEEDLGAIAGKRGVSWLEQNAKNATWILTRGENGAASVGAHGQATAPTRRVRCIDATGAGDAFLGAAVASLALAGATPGEAAFRDAAVWTRALEIGHQVAAKVIAHVGATTGLASLDDVRTRMEMNTTGNGRKR